jgi:hypothetical protein
MIIYNITVEFKQGNAEVFWFATAKEARKEKKRIMAEYDENIRRCEGPVRAVTICRASYPTNKQVTDWLNTPSRWHGRAI